MLEKFQQIAEIIEREKGPITIFGLFKMDDITDKWSVVLSSEWIDEDKDIDNNEENFNYVSKVISSVITTEEDKTIARIGFFPTQFHLISLLLEFKSGSRIQEQMVNGNVIHDGYVVKSNNNVESHYVPIEKTPSSLNNAHIDSIE